MRRYRSKRNNDANEAFRAQLFQQCIDGFHSRAKELGYAEHGLINVPELLEYGAQAVRWYYENETIREVFDDDDTNLYYMTAIGTALRCGILFGLKWYLGSPELQRPGYVEHVLENISEETGSLIWQEFDLDEDTFADFSIEIFMRWSEILHPCFARDDAMLCIFDATMAAYLLGISMILCKYQS